MENNKPKISVIMAVYNGQKHLKEAIDSILEQSFSDFEFLIVDDASTDKSPQILADYASKDQRLKIITNSQNLGLTKSLNKALSKAQGKYIARMDADDISLPGRLEKQLQFMEGNPNMALCGCLGWVINEKGEEIREKNLALTYNEIKKKLLFNNQFLHSSLFIRKSILDTEGFYDETFERAQDYELVLRLASKYPVANLPERLIKWRFNEKSLSFVDKKQQKCAIRARWWAITKYGYPKLRGLFHIALRIVRLSMPCLSLFRHDRAETGTIKILQVITLSQWGGAQRVLYDLVSNLSKDKFVVDVACGPAGPLVKKLREQGIRVFEIPVFVRQISPLRDLKALFLLYRLIRKGKYDVVHCHSTKAGFLGRIIAKLAGVKKIYFTAHGWGFYNQEEYGRINWLFVLAEKIAAKFSTKIICVSEKGKQDALKNKIASEDKFLVIKNGIAPILAKKAMAFLASIGEIVIGMVGRLSYPKDPILFLKAAKEIKNNFPHAKFVLIGTGPLMKDCQDFVSANRLESSILLLGEKSPEQTRRLLLTFDIFVLCSKFEGLPITIIEAMFAGLPIVASGVGGVGELVKHNQNGFLIKPQNLAELKEKIIYLIKNPSQRERMGKESLKIAQVNFSLERMIKEYEKLFIPS